MTPGSDLPQEWWGDPFKAWSILDSGRQDDEHKRLAGEVAVIREKLEGKQKQDLDAAHQKIRDLQKSESTRRRSHLGINAALVAAVYCLVEVIKVLVQHWH